MQKLQKMQFSYILPLILWLVVVCIAQDLPKVQKPLSQKNNEKQYVLNKTKENGPSDVVALKVDSASQNLTREEQAQQISKKEGKEAQNPIRYEKAAQNPIGEEKNAHQYPIRVKKTAPIPIKGENLASNPVGGDENPQLNPIREEKTEQSPIKAGEKNKQNPNEELTAKSDEQSKANVGFNPIKEKQNVQNLENGNVECPLTTVDCLCDADTEKEQIIQVNLKTISVVDEKTGKSKCFAEGDPLGICENKKCIIIPNKNFEILFQRGKKVYLTNHLDNTREQDAPRNNPENKSQGDGAGPVVLDTFLSTFFPVEYTYPRVLDESHSRVARSAYGSNMCRVPTLANSEVTCWKWPNWQTCKQVCIYGHGLESGGKTVREKSFTCRNTENKWKPHAIRDCEPFMNCKVHLKSPGDLNCVEPTDGPAYCDINCADYDDYHSHGKVTWKCEEKAMRHGKHHLPHCAAFEDSVVRLNPPDY